LKTETGNIDEMKETAYSRKTLYYLLHRAFIQEIDEDFLKELRSPEMKTIFDEMEIDLGKDFYEGDTEKVLEDFAVEYASLFLSFRRLLSPYESAIKEGKIDCTPAAPVEDFYAKCGFAVPDEVSQDKFKVLPDHIGVEFEFMHKLVSREYNALTQGNESDAEEVIKLQSEFLKKHIGSWVPKFCTLGIAKTNNPFYKNMLELAQEFVKSELDEFDIIIDG